MAANINASGSSGTSTSPHLQSPNAIPPRTSSTGHSTAAAATAATLTPPAKSVLRPVPEADWLAQSIPIRPSSGLLSPQHPFTGMASASPPDPARYATEDFDYTARQTWSPDKEEAITSPYNYLVGQPGKDIRTSLINAFNVWLQVPRDALDVIARVVAMLHTSSLLIDDVEDNSTLRRGLPVAHSIYGMPQTINSANYVYFRALQELQKLSNPAAAVAIFAEEVVNLHRGQGMDLLWRDMLVCPTEDLYLEMVGNKTGGLFRLAVKLMQAESPRVKTSASASASGSGSSAPPPLDCVPLVNVLGIIFQIQDDYRNLASPDYGRNKGFCEDLTEGKFSFPIIHSIRANPRDHQLLSILQQKTTNEDVKRYAVEYMRGTGSFEYTKKVLDVLIARARKTADELGGGGPAQSAGIHQILDKLAV